MEEQNNSQGTGWAWFALLGGILAVIGQWYGTGSLPVIGGIVAVIGSLGTMN